MDFKNVEHSIFKAFLLEDSLDRLEDHGITIRKDPREPSRDQHHLQDFSPKIRYQAIQMTDVYVAFFCLENAVRELIIQKLSENHGPDWWSKCVPKKINDRVESLKTKEKKNKYHAQRSDANIGYTTFGNLAQIIISNWDDFSDLFPDQSWITSRFNDLEMSRNIIMHTNILPDSEIERIKSLVRDWLSQVG